MARPVRGRAGQSRSARGQARQALLKTAVIAAGANIRGAVRDGIEGYGFSCLFWLLVAVTAPAWPATASTGQPAPATTVEDPCLDTGEGTESGLDILRERMFTGVCASARWFDGLFGNEREKAGTYDQANGRAGVGLAWNKIDGLRPDSHFRASFPLPRLGRRFNAVIGRESQDRVISDRFDDTSFLAGSFSDDQARDWYAGINFNAAKGADSSFDLGGGVQVKSPLNPYVKARYTRFAYPAEHVRLTGRATTFWENQDGFGVTLALDSDWSLRDDTLLRWTNTVTRSEGTDGLRWKSRVALYHALTGQSAIRYELAVRGQTGGVQPDLTEAKVTHRRSMWRSWFFLESFAGLFWSDSVRPARRCNGCVELGLGFEMMFGERYDQPSGDNRAVGP